MYLYWLKLWHNVRVIVIHIKKSIYAKGSKCYGFITISVNLIQQILYTGSSSAFNEVCMKPSCCYMGCIEYILTIWE